jgi:molybdate transport system permease protein
MNEPAISAVGLSLAMGLCAVGLDLVPGIVMALILARRSFPGKSVLEALVFLPLVLPPVVTGYFLLRIFSQNSFLGGFLAGIGIKIIFTPAGMALAAAVMGFPLLVRTVRAWLENIDPRLEQAARTLGCSKLSSLFSVTLPLAWPGIVAGSVLCFARALGEFGATAMVSAGTPGQRTIALEIFRYYQSPGHEETVVRLALVSIGLSMVALAASEALIRKTTRLRFEKMSGEKP